MLFLLLAWICVLTNSQVASEMRCLNMHVASTIIRQKWVHKKTKHTTAFTFTTGITISGKPSLYLGGALAQTDRKMKVNVTHMQYLKITPISWISSQGRQMNEPLIPIELYCLPIWRWKSIKPNMQYRELNELQLNDKAAGFFSINWVIV